jgi:signal transduction histidine kinase
VSFKRKEARIAHEIHNPRTAITLFVDITPDAERFDRCDQELEILTEIKVGCKTIGNIVTRILDFAKPVTFSRKAVSINHQTLSSRKATIFFCVS